VSFDPPQRYYTRTDLFLVRIWTRGASDGTSDEVEAGGDDAGESTGTLEWQGQVQRAGDGEAYQFNSWQGLLDLLLAMLSDKRGRLER